MLIVRGTEWTLEHATTTPIVQKCKNPSPHDFNPLKEYYICLGLGLALAIPPQGPLVTQPKSPRRTNSLKLSRRFVSSSGLLFVGKKEWKLLD
jgi:hypothetical protein